MILLRRCIYSQKLQGQKPEVEKFEDYVKQQSIGLGLLTSIVAFRISSLSKLGLCSTITDLLRQHENSHLIACASCCKSALCLGSFQGSLFYSRLWLKRKLSRLAPLYGLEYESSIPNEYIIMFQEGHTLEQHYHTIGRNLSLSDLNIWTFNYV